MKLYFDTSAIVSLFLDEARGETVAVLLDGHDEVLVSDLLIGEFGAAVTAAARAKRLRWSDAERVLELFD